MSAGYKNILDKSKGWKRALCLANGEELNDSDNSGDVELGRIFEAEILDFVKGPDGSPKLYMTKNKRLSILYKIRILEKSNKSATGNELFTNPALSSNMSDLAGGFFCNMKQARYFYTNMHPEGVFIQHGDATEIPKIGDKVQAVSEKIEGRYIITAKNGSAASKSGGYADHLAMFQKRKGKTAEEIMNGRKVSTAYEKQGNGTAVSEYPEVYIKNSSVRWDCVDPEVKKSVVAISQDTGFPLTVTSGYRDAAANKKVLSSDNSQHTFGQAVDLRSADKTLEDLYEIKKSALRNGLSMPAALNHGTFEHFHFQSVKNKSKFTTAIGCAEVAAAKGVAKNDDAHGTKIETGQSTASNQGMSNASLDGTTEA